MNYRKIIILPAFFFLSHLVYIGCCKCIEGTFYRDFSSLRIQQFSHSNLNSRDTLRVTDTLFSLININYSMITKKFTKNPVSAFVNSAYAFQCNCSNYFDNGFKFPIDSIVIKSDNIFKGIPAGENIGTYFKGVYINVNSNNLYYLPLSQLKDSLNQNRRYYSINLVANPGAVVPKIHHLTYFIFINGKSYQQVGDETIIWQ